MESKKIVIIGAGNVATHLSKALFDEGYEIVQVFSRSMRSAVELASVFECGFTTDLSKVVDDADVYLICVSDSAIRTVLLGLNVGDKLILHTAGSVNINVFEECSKVNYGVLYPLQTFSKFKSVNFHEIPLFIEGNNEETENVIYDIARKISTKVVRCNQQKRLMLHLSAVFACNFTNHMLAVAEDILKSNNLQFDVLRPLLKETFDKVTKYSPSQSQTGPAVRNDKNVVNKHIDLLADRKNYEDIYKAVSSSIWEFKQNNDGKV